MTEDGTGKRVARSSRSPESPDSKKIAVHRRVPGFQRDALRSCSRRRLISYSRRSSRATTASRETTLDRDQPVVIDPRLAEHSIVDNHRAFPGRLRHFPALWRADAARIHLSSTNQRGHETFRVIEDERRSARRPEVLIDEHPGAFFDYRLAVPGLHRFGPRRFRADVNDGREIIWMSERDGWTICISRR